MTQFKYPNILNEISDKFSSINKNIYIVGGYCRDYFFWIQDSFSDIDLATDALPSETEKLFPGSKNIWKKYWTIQICYKWFRFEVTTFRKDIGILDNRHPIEISFTDNIIEDANRRDFTINAIYFNVRNHSWLDPVNGISDTKDKYINFIHNPSSRIQEDALRILRYVRIKYKYGLIDPKTENTDILRDNIGLLQYISIERIQEEFQQILSEKHHGDAIFYLNSINFFKQIYWVSIDKKYLDTFYQKHSSNLNIIISFALYMQWVSAANLKKLLWSKDTMILSYLMKNFWIMKWYGGLEEVEKYKILSHKYCTILVNVLEIFLSDSESLEIVRTIKRDFNLYCLLKKKEAFQDWNNLKKTIGLVEGKSLWEKLKTINAGILFWNKDL